MHPRQQLCARCNRCFLGLSDPSPSPGPLHSYRSPRLWSLVTSQANTQESKSASSGNAATTVVSRHYPNRHLSLQNTASGHYSPFRLRRVSATPVPRDPLKSRLGPPMGFLTIRRARPAGRRPAALRPSCQPRPSKTPARVATRPVAVVSRGSRITTGTTDGILNQAKSR